MYKVELIEKNEYLKELQIDRYVYHVNHMELIFPNAARIKVLPYDRILFLNIFPIPAETGGEGG